MPPSTPRLGPSPPSTRSPRTRCTGWTGRGGPPPSAPGGNWSGYHHPADPIGPETVAAGPNLRAAWHGAFAALGPIDGPDVRGMADGLLLHLRDTYPIETAWAPKWVGDELRQVRATAWEARLAGLRAGAEAAAAQQRGTTKKPRASRSWPTATRPCTMPTASGQREELTMTAGEETRETGQWIKDLAAAHHAFADRLADRLSLAIPSQDPDYGGLGQAFPPWPGPGDDAILRPPKPEIRPSLQVLQRAADRDQPG